MNTFALGTLPLNAWPAADVVLQRDDYVLRDIRARLEGIGLFRFVKLGRMPKEATVAADTDAVAWVKRTSYREEKAAAPYEKLHIAEFSIWIVTVRGDEFKRNARLIYLIEAAHQAIENQPLAGSCLPAFTTLRQGRDLPEGDGRSGCELVGSFRYIHDNSRVRCLAAP